MIVWSVGMQARMFFFRSTPTAKSETPTTENETALAQKQARNKRFLYSMVIFAVAAALLVSFWVSRSKKTEKAVAPGEKPAKRSIKNESKSEEVPDVDEEAMLELALKLKQAGAKVYGVTQCGWTKRQRDLFGGRASPARKILEDIYVECHTSDMCPGVQGYPTWEVAGKQFPGFKASEQLGEISEYKPILKKKVKHHPAKKKTVKLEVIEEEESESDEEVVEDTRGVEIEEIHDEPEEQPEEEPASSEDEVPVKKPVKKRARKSRVEKARGVSAYAPLAVPDMPGTAVFEPSASRTVTQAEQGNVPRQSLENNDPVVAMANQFAQSYEQIARDQERDDNSALVLDANLPQSATISTGDALATKDIPKKKRSEKKQ